MPGYLIGLREDKSAHYISFLLQVVLRILIFLMIRICRYNSE